MLTFGVVVLGVTDRQRAEEFWCAALGYQVSEGRPYLRLAACGLVLH